MLVLFFVLKSMGLVCEKSCDEALKSMDLVCEKTCDGAMAAGGAKVDARAHIRLRKRRRGGRKWRDIMVGSLIVAIKTGLVHKLLGWKIFPAVAQPGPNPNLF